MNEIEINELTMEEITSLQSSFNNNKSEDNFLNLASKIFKNNTLVQNLFQTITSHNASNSQQLQNSTEIKVSTENTAINQTQNQNEINPQKQAPKMISQQQKRFNEKVNMKIKIPKEAIEKKFIEEDEMTLEEIESFNPGEFSYFWLEDDQNYPVVTYGNYEYIDENDLKIIDLSIEVDHLYLVKWRNLSYLDSTWEHESAIDNISKLYDFRQFNRSLDKQTRMSIQQSVDRHKVLINLLNNPKKVRYNSAQITDIYNKLYQYNIKQKKKPIQYTQRNQPIYKQKKLLRYYQLDCLNWLITAYYERRNVILADEMGLGKTIETISFLNYLAAIEQQRGPFLVIAPLSTIEHWNRTGSDWTNLNTIVYYDQNGQEGRNIIQTYEWFYTDISTKGSLLQTNELYKFHIMITSYEVFNQDLNNSLYKIPFQYIVIDEAHRLKSQNAKLLQSLKRLPCKRLLLLTGTPIQNNTEELWNLLNYIEPQRFYSFDFFSQEFGNLNNSAQIEKLQEMLKPYLLRRMKDDVEKSIPPLEETIIDVEMTNTQKSLYRAIYEKNKALLTRGFSTSNFSTSMNNIEMQLRKCCNHPFLLKEIEDEILVQCKTAQEQFDKTIEVSGKMLLLDKLLVKFKEEQKKVLIFSQFTQMLEILEYYLKARQFKYEKIDGSVKAKERQNAIDRFNDPAKNRDVFLLSTKAGGLGINLTSASQVIIYDSDWNPQNDIQAIARAHRIGQGNKVLVYRLVTSKTYEAEMLNRATKKKGLDQAVFLGGAFSDGINKKDGNKKISKEEIELLLKKGILGFIEKEQGEDNVQPQENIISDENIENIIENQGSKANFSLINGTYTFNKSSFVSNKTDQAIDINDPNFWNLVLKNEETASEKLLKELRTNPTKYEEKQEQKQFIIEVYEQMTQLIEIKLNNVGYNADEENNIIEILNSILSMHCFHRYYRQYATQWLDEIAKPSRRFKKLTLKDFDIQLGGIRKSLNENQLENYNDKDGIFEDELNDKLSDDLPNSPRKNKVIKKVKDYSMKKICNYCERNKCTIFCEGICQRQFHEHCYKLVNEDGKICGKEENKLNFQVAELDLDETQLQERVKTVICKDCENEMGICYNCKKKGYFKAKKKRQQQNQESQIGEDQLIQKCSIANCSKFYHLKCIKGLQNIKYIDENQTKFRCPLHYCAKCSISGDALPLIQCIRCINSYHSKCYNKDDIIRLNKKLMICPKHKSAISKYQNEQKKREEQIQQEKQEQKDKIIQQKMKEKNEKNKKKQLEQLAKLKKKKTTTNFPQQRKLAHLRSSTKLQQQQQQELEDQIQETDESNEQSLTSPKQPRRFIKKKIPIGFANKNKLIKKYTYDELKLQPPQDFDYENYNKDWCRYCGARIASNHTKGPWGPRTLCTIHYIEWGQKNKLNLSSYKELPVKPINFEANTELEFISKMKYKNSEFDPLAILNEPPKIKKIKKEEDDSTQKALFEAQYPGSLDQNDEFDFSFKIQKKSTMKNDKSPQRELQSKDQDNKEEAKLEAKDIQKEQNESKEKPDKVNNSKDQQQKQPHDHKETQDNNKQKSSSHHDYKYNKTRSSQNEHHHHDRNRSSDNRHERERDLRDRDRNRKKSNDNKYSTSNSRHDRNRSHTHDKYDKNKSNHDKRR